MNGWWPHWPTVIVSIFTVFAVTFAKEAAVNLAKRIFGRKKDKEETDDNLDD